MRIGLCDDDIIDRNFIKFCLNKYSISNNVEYQLHEYDNGEALIIDLQNHTFDLFLLDIYMHNMTGMEVAREIRNQDKDVSIVFITSSKDFAILSSRIRVKVKISNIMYAEVFNTVCVLHTTEGEYRTYITLDELCGLLEDNRFIRCHRSFLANLDYVDKIEKNNFILKNLTKVPIGRKYCVEVKKLYYSNRFH